MKETAKLNASPENKKQLSIFQRFFAAIREGLGNIKASFTAWVTYFKCKLSQKPKHPESSSEQSPSQLASGASQIEKAKILQESPRTMQAVQDKINSNRALTIKDADFVLAQANQLKLELPKPDGTFETFAYNHLTKAIKDLESILSKQEKNTVDNSVSKTGVELVGKIAQARKIFEAHNDSRKKKTLY